MNIKRLTTFIAGVFATTAMLSAQSYFDDDIYYDASKATKPAKKSVNNNANKQNTVIVYDYPSADNFTVNGTRKISVDDYNRRGIFATDSLTSDTTATDFAYTRRIEQFYNPEIVSGSGDQELANIYYMEPDQVNIYVNTPSGYWGYDYFYPYTAWTSPYWYNNYWRWNSGWYWGSWYDPYWAWNWGPAWGPSWSWGPVWGPGWGWGPSWGIWNSGPKRAPNLLAGRHPSNSGNYRPSGNRRPDYGSNRPSYNNNRPSYNNRRPSVGLRPDAISRPGSTGTTNRRPGNSGVNTRPSTNQNNNSYNRPSNNSYNRPSGTSGGGRYNYGTGGFGGGSRGSGGGRSSGGGRGRH